MVAAIAIEKALELAYQHTWMTIEIWMHDSEIITLLSKGGDKPIKAIPGIEHCISSKQYFTYFIFR